jgi:hypothetical protein
MAFHNCTELTSLELPEGLETINYKALDNCESLRHIALPLKDDMLYTRVFNDCTDLTSVGLVGGIHKTVASLHLVKWRNEMKVEINRINQVLPFTSLEKTDKLCQQYFFVCSTRNISTKKTTSLIFHRFCPLHINAG